MRGIVLCDRQRDLAHLRIINIAHGSEIVEPDFAEFAIGRMRVAGNPPAAEDDVEEVNLVPVDVRDARQLLNESKSLDRNVDSCFFEAFAHGRVTPSSFAATLASRPCC